MNTNGGCALSSSSSGTREEHNGTGRSVAAHLAHSCTSLARSKERHATGLRLPVLECSPCTNASRCSTGRSFALPRSPAPRACTTSVHRPACVHRAPPPRGGGSIRNVRPAAPRPRVAAAVGPEDGGWLQYTATACSCAASTVTTMRERTRRASGVSVVGDDGTALRGERGREYSASEISVMALSPPSPPLAPPTTRPASLLLPSSLPESAAAVGSTGAPTPTHQRCEREAFWLRHRCHFRRRSSSSASWSLSSSSLSLLSSPLSTRGGICVGGLPAIRVTLEGAPGIGRPGPRLHTRRRQPAAAHTGAAETTIFILVRRALLDLVAS
jgi:hypothetical protein